MKMRNQRYGGEWERTEIQQQVGGDGDWAQGKGKSIEGVTLAGCGQDTLL